MRNINVLFSEFIDDESGLTAVEYAIAGGLVVAGMVTAFLTLGERATERIVELGDAVDGTAPTTTP